MSYYRGSFSTMPSRGRGGYSSRGGSYRGSNYRGSSSYRGSNSYNDRGGYSGSTSSRGRYPATSSYNSSTFETRSRYPSGSSSDRYSTSRGGGRDDGYRRTASYREVPSYVSREHSSGRGSPERKRMRTEQGSSSRRSHENYGASDYNPGRYESSYVSERRYSDRPRSPKEFRSREMFRKPEPMMPPPSSMPMRRGIYRGRMSSRGGMRGRGIMRRSENIIRRRPIDAYSMRRRIISTKAHDYARRLKIQKLRSSLKKGNSGSSPEASDKEEDWDEELDDEEIKKITAEEDKGVEKEVVKKVTPKKEPKTKPAAGSGDEATDKEEVPSGDEAMEVDTENPKKTNGKPVTADEPLPRSRYTGRAFIKLTCVHCHSKCVTFNEYASHLRYPRHISAMRTLALRQKGQLARMRLNQRNAQRDIDEKVKDPHLRTQFCPVCKLNYRQLKAKHLSSESHRRMRKFLMPYCAICDVNFKSPMLYEAHVCSLEHIKRNARIESKKSEAPGDASGDDEVKELDLENFMTLDSVGDVDEVDDENEDGEKVEGEEKPKVPKIEVNVGSEHVKKVEVYYCELCIMYLPRLEELETALKKHCRSRSHLQKYVRYRDDKALRREAERIHRKNQEAKEARAKEKAEKAAADETAAVAPIKKDKDAAPPATAAAVPTENGSVDEDAGDDKLWADVDKDLGELLREVEPNKSSDDEDDSRATTGRYDRFRYSDKKGAKGEKPVELKTKEVVEKEDVEEKMEIPETESVDKTETEEK